MSRPRLRSKTGCLKCRSRGVKCDEKHPKCSACLKWNFECIWPSAPRGGRSIDAARPGGGSRTGASQQITQVHTHQGVNFDTPESPTFRYGPSWKTEERQAFEFFCSQTSKGLFGVFRVDREMNLWSHTLLQSAHQNDGIRYAVCALGAIHQHVWNRLGSGEGQAYRFAVQQHRQAVQWTISSTHRSRMSVDTVLIMCVLLTLVERFFGNIKNAMSHLEAGMKLLVDSTNPLTGSQHDTSISEQKISVPRTAIKVLLRRLERQVFELGQWHFELDPTRGFSNMNFPDEFSTLEDAVGSFEEYFNDSNYQMHTCIWNQDEQHRALKPVEPDLAFLLRRMLVKWNDAFIAFLQNRALRQLTFSASDELIVHMLHVQRRVLLFSLIYYQTGDEMLGDELKSEFDQALTHCAAVVHAQRRKVDELKAQTHPRGFTPLASQPSSSNGPNMSSVHPLVSAQHPPPGTSHYIQSESPGNVVLTCAPFSPVPAISTIGWRCRDPILRRRALQLLQEVDWYDAFWDSRFLRRVGERLVQFEENGYFAGEAYSGQSRFVENAQQIIPAARCKLTRAQFKQPHVIVVDFWSTNVKDWLPEPEKWNGRESDSFCKAGHIREMWTMLD